MIDSDGKRLLGWMAVTCTVSIIARRANRPADEMFEAGRLLGRAEAHAEHAAPNVVPIAKIAATGPRARLRLLEGVERLR